MSDKPAASDEASLPTWEEMLKTVGTDLTENYTSQETYEDRFSGISIEAQRSYEHLIGLQTHYSHKRKWSFFLMGSMAFMILFQSFLLWKVGTGSWNFTQYNWLLPALLVQNLGQIIGLAVIVVKSLFTNIDPPRK